MNVGTHSNKSCYAIHYIGEKRDVIVYNWAECIEARKGYPNLYKKFETTEDAKDWLASITPEQEQKHLQTMEYVNAKNANKSQRTVWIDNDLLVRVESKISQLNVKLTDLVEDLLRDYADYEDVVECGSELTEDPSSCEREDEKVITLRESAVKYMDEVEGCIRSFTRYPNPDDYRRLVIDIHATVRDYAEVKVNLFGTQQ